VGTTNSKPLAPIIMIDQSETGTSSQIIFLLHSSLAGAQLGGAFYKRRRKLSKYAREKPFS
jgi:hypothetical protein